MQKNIDLLSKTFGRPVIGVHNKTYGMIADILECLIQRDFFYNTMDVRVTYEYLKACLCDPTIRKIVLVAHSQGGIVATMALDHLFADLPREVFSKLVRIIMRVPYLVQLNNGLFSGTLHLWLCSFTLQQSSFPLTLKFS